MLLFLLRKSDWFQGKFVSSSQIRLILKGILKRILQRIPIDTMRDPDILIRMFVSLESFCHHEKITLIAVRGFVSHQTHWFHIDSNTFMHILYWQQWPQKECRLSSYELIHRQIFRRSMFISPYLLSRIRFFALTLFRAYARPLSFVANFIP